MISAPAATLIAALIGVFGALSGLMVERVLRTFGRLYCELSDWSPHFNEKHDTSVFDEDDLEDLGLEKTTVERVYHTFRYSVKIDLYNSKEIPVGLRDVSLVFTHDEGEKPEKPWDTQSRSVGEVYRGVQSRPFYKRIEVVNLPPKQWVHLELHGEMVIPAEVYSVQDWRKVEFVGKRQRRGYFEKQTYRKTIYTPAVTETTPS